MSVVDTLSFALGGAGVVVVVIMTVLGGRWRLGLSLALDLWLAAGLLRLTADLSWRGIASAATIVVIRQLVGFGMRADRRVFDPVTPGAGPTPA